MNKQQTPPFTRHSPTANPTVTTKTRTKSKGEYSKAKKSKRMDSQNKKTNNNKRAMKNESRKIKERAIRKGKSHKIDNTKYERFRLTITFIKIKMSNNNQCNT
jgi:hypothetical protein